MVSHYIFSVDDCDGNLDSSSAAVHVEVVPPYGDGAAVNIDIAALL